MKKGKLFEDDHKRLNGGNSDYGGLANVNWNYPNKPWNNISFRPLEVFQRKGAGFARSLA